MKSLSNFFCPNVKSLFPPIQRVCVERSSGTVIPLEGEGIERIAMSMAVIHYRERIPVTGSKGKSTGGEFWGKPGASFQDCCPCGATQDALNFSQQWVTTTRVECCHPGKLIRTSMPRVFTGSWSHMCPLPGTYSTSRLQEGKQMFSINQLLLKQFRPSEPLLSVNGRNLPEIKFPDDSPGPTL